jgi:CheY-like chemotaxis protein
MPQGVRFSPPSLATLDLPRGKVLVVVDDAIVALDLQRLLHEAGYRVVGPATTVAEIQRMIQRGDIDCAIVDLDVDLYEEVCYDHDSGQLMTGSLLDYAVPRADGVPNIRSHFQETPSPTNPLGAKGIGESGPIGAPPTVNCRLVDQAE